jgi:hypothetical protein
MQGNVLLGEWHPQVCSIGTHWHFFHFLYILNTLDVGPWHPQPPPEWSLQWERQRSLGEAIVNPHLFFSS